MATKAELWKIVEAYRQLIDTLIVEGGTAVCVINCGEERSRGMTVETDDAMNAVYALDSYHDRREDNNRKADRRSTERRT